MTNIVRLADVESPFERFKVHNPIEYAELVLVISNLSGSSKNQSGFILQEIVNTLHRTASKRLSDLRDQ